MALTPADIHHVEFPKAPIGRRGYDVDDVDRLLDEVFREMAELLEEKDVLKRRAGAGDFTDPVEADRTVRAEISAVRTELERARRECERAQDAARAAQRRLDQARQAAAPPTGEHGGVVVASAQRTADGHLAEARLRSEALAAEGRDKSEQMVREALQLARDLADRTSRVEREMADDLREREAAARRDIEEMTTFAEQYRAVLLAHLGHQVQLVDGAG